MRERERQRDRFWWYFCVGQQQEQEQIPTFHDTDHFFLSLVLDASPGSESEFL